MTLIISFLGPPGSGKGTQSTLLGEVLNMPVVSTGEMLRDEIKNKTELSQAISPMINQGNLVPDEIILKLLKNRMKSFDVEKGIILDGFPRTLSQAENFDDLIQGEHYESYILFLDVNYDIVRLRLLNRERDDDKEKIIKMRYETQTKQIKVITEYFGNRVRKIDGTKPSDRVFKNIMKAMEL